MTPRVQSSQRQLRAGFTLVELLVAVTIFIILTTLTLATINLNLGSERITAGTRQVQAMLEGARSRAFKLRQPVGVRFILDANFPGEASSMIYVGSVDTAGGGTQTGRLRFVDLNNGTAPIRPGIQQLQTQTSLTWKELKQLQLLRSGVKIRIPARTGSWYTISSNNFLNAANPYNESVMELNETPLDITGYGLLNQNFNTNTGMIADYELDLSAVMVPLPNQSPVQLPPGTVIDLKSSKVPSKWRINRWQSEFGYTEGVWVAAETSSGLKTYRSNNPGTSGTSQPNWNAAVLNGSQVVDNGIQWICYDAPLLDLIFTPQGTLQGPTSAEGVIHLTLAETRDTRTPLDDGSVGLRAWDLRDINGDGNRPDHRGSFRVVTVFPASGAIGVSHVDQSPSSGNPDVAANIFNFALQGMEAK